MKKLMLGFILIISSGMLAASKKEFTPVFPQEKNRLGEPACKECSYNPATDTVTCVCTIGYEQGEGGAMLTKQREISGSGCKAYRYNSDTKKLECTKFMPQFPQEKLTQSLRNKYQITSVEDPRGFLCKNCSYNAATDTITCSCVVGPPVAIGGGRFRLQYQVITGSGCKAYEYDIETKSLKCKE